MKVVMLMNWAGVTPDQYYKVREIANWEGNVPDGAVLHVACFDNNGIRVTDVWDSAEQFNNFVATRLMPAVTQVGIAAQPNVEIYPAERLFAPGIAQKSQAEFV